MEQWKPFSDNRSTDSEKHWVNKLKDKKQKFEKPTIKDLIELTDEKISEEIVQLLIEQIEEYCLIIIEEYDNRKQI